MISDGVKGGVADTINYQFIKSINFQKNFTSDKDKIDMCSSANIAPVCKLIIKFDSILFRNSHICAMQLSNLKLDSIKFTSGIL